MIRDHSHGDKRSAFTLVELMVVILIIAILVSLISSAVMKALGKIPEVQTRTEISEMAVGLEAFMSDYGLSDPPPSVLFLNEFAPSTTPSGPFLQKVFGKNLGPTDWNGDGVIAPPNITWTLQGEQCLVFYLGGIPSNPNNLLTPGVQPAGLGFSTNNMKPSYGSMVGETMGRRKGPYFNFVTSRLWPQTILNTPPGTFYIYLDPWQTKTGPLYTTLGGSPYSFFSSAGINNGYVATSGFGRLPFATGVGQFTYPNKYQIVSAGKDGILVGGPWSPTSGAVGADADDQANFSGTLLGVGQN